MAGDMTGCEAHARRRLSRCGDQDDPARTTKEAYIPSYVTRKRLAKMMGLSEATLRSYVSAGALRGAWRIQRQDSSWVRRPPSRAPVAPPAPATALHTPIARARPRG